MSIDTLDGSSHHYQQSQMSRVFEELVALVEVYQSLPSEALRVVLDARGFGRVLDLETVGHTYLVALAVHTHSPEWKDVRRLHRSMNRQGGRSGPVFVDVPLG